MAGATCKQYNFHEAWNIFYGHTACLLTIDHTHEPDRKPNTKGQHMVFGNGACFVTSETYYMAMKNLREPTVPSVTAPNMADGK